MKIKEVNNEIKGIDCLDSLLPIARSKSRELESLLSENNRFIWAEPCGGYKTLATAAFISMKWSKGILYTAERTESLKKMKDLLVKFGVPEEVIGVYYCRSNDLNEDRRLDWKSWIVTTNPKTVALVTHQRLKIEPSTWWMNTAEQKQRKYLFVDEPFDLITIAYSNRITTSGFINKIISKKVQPENPDDPKEIKIYLEELLNNPLESKEITKVINKFSEYFDVLAKNYPDQILSFYNRALRTLTADTPLGAQRRYHFYINYVKALLSGRFKLGKDIIQVMVYLSPELNWLDAFDKSVVLDATGYFYPHYHGAKIISKSSWYKKLYDFYCCSYHITKSMVIKDGEVTKSYLFDAAVREIKERVTERDRVLLITWKDAEDYIKSIVPESWTVRHYGENRGSNEYLDHDTVILIGDYVLPPEIIIGIQSYWDSVDQNNMALAETIQEIYRSQLRIKKTIKLIHIGNLKIQDKLKEFFSRTLADEFTLKLNYEEEITSLTKLSRIQKDIISEVKPGVCYSLDSFAEKLGVRTDNLQRSVDRLNDRLTTANFKVEEGSLYLKIL